MVPNEGVILDADDMVDVAGSESTDIVSGEEDLSFEQLDVVVQNTYIAQKLGLTLAMVSESRFTYNRHMQRDLPSGSLEEAAAEMTVWRGIEKCRWPDIDDMDD